MDHSGNRFGIRWYVLKRNFWLWFSAPASGGSYLPAGRSIMDEKPLLGFGRTRSIKGHGFYLRLPVMERLRAARGMKQAVVKVTSYAHGLTRVRNLVDYISRRGSLELET